MIPWWGYLIIGIASAAFMSWVVVLAIIVASAKAELKRAKTHADLLRAQMRHPSHRSHRPHRPANVSQKIWDDPDFDWPGKPPF